MYHKKKITPYQIFSVLNVLFMLLVILVTAYPVYYIVIASFSDPGALSRHIGLLWAPMKPYTLTAYETVFRNPQIVTGFLNTLFVLGVGLLVNLTMTMLGAFFLTIKGPMLKDAIALMIIFTMYFSGGLIPSYLNIRDLKLMDSLTLPDVMDAVKHLLLFYHEEHFYYLHITLLVYAALPVTRLIARHADKRLLEYTLALWFLLGILYSTVRPFCPFTLLSGIPVQWRMNMVYASIGYMLLGYYLSVHHPRPSRGTSSLALLAGFLLAF